jgi:integrase
MAAQVAADSSLKPRTHRFYAEVFAAVAKSFDRPGRDLRLVSDDDLRGWAAKFSAEYCATRHNCAIGFLRRLFSEAVERGFLPRSPAACLKRARVRSKELHLPSADEFTRLLAELDAGGGRDSRNCADLVRFLAFGGCRISEAGAVCWRDVDFERGEIVVRGADETGTKNWSVRRVPMIPEMRQLLERLHAGQPDADPVMQIRECQRALTRACKAIGIHRMTHHMLRHLFGTRCMENGVDVRTVAEWLGHRDHGALLLRTYGHVRSQHSQEMARRVSFSTPPPASNVVPLDPAKSA